MNCLKSDLTIYLDLRNRLDGLSDDEHVVSCKCCRSLLLKYEQLSDLSDLSEPESESKPVSVSSNRVSSKRVPESKSTDHDETCVEPILIGRDARLNLAASASANRLMGWSTVLAVLFLIWGAPTQELDTSVHRLDRTSAVALMQGERYWQVPSGDLLAGQLANVSMRNVNLSCLPSIEKLGLGQYWQRASRLPGIEPWQHSVSFAIGWINQGEPRGVQSPLLERPGDDTRRLDLDCPDLGQQNRAKFALCVV